MSVNTLDRSHVVDPMRQTLRVVACFPVCPFRLLPPNWYLDTIPEISIEAANHGLLFNLRKTFTGR